LQPLAVLREEAFLSNFLVPILQKSFADLNHQLNTAHLKNQSFSQTYPNERLGWSPNLGGSLGSSTARQARHCAVRLWGTGNPGLLVRSSFV